MLQPRHRPSPSAFAFMAGGGEMGTLMSSLDWESTPLGPVTSWPESLRISVSTCLGSRFPMLIWWGRDLAMLYNDAYRPMLGNKHPRSLGQPGRECWPEIWDIIGPMLAGVMEQGAATWSENLMLPLERRGYPEECYFTFSYSPIRGDGGTIEGVFCAVKETTEQVIGERRLGMLRTLAGSAGEASSVEATCRHAMEVIGRDSVDIPFALLYLSDKTGDTVRLAAMSGVEPGDTIAVPTLEVDTENRRGGTWPLGIVARSDRAELVENLGSLCQRVPAGPWPEPPASALVLPVRANLAHRPAGFLIAGVSARRPLDEQYRGFCDLVAAQLSTAIAHARAYEEERQRAEALAELDRAKTRFFSNVSHEFRTPLTLMLGPLEDLLSRPDSELPAADRETLRLAHRNGQRLLKLVNTLLDFSRIEAGRVQAAYEPVDLAQYTAELASVFRSAIEKAGLRLVVDCPPLREPVYVDRDMWEKIVLNLVSNAFKFTFEGEIHVSLRARDGAAILEVRDTGTGIPIEELPRLFNRFFRIQNARGRSSEGTGIGLALVQELARLHGGTVAASSEYRVGSTFTVRIPFGRAHLPADRVTEPRAAGRLVPHGARVYVDEVLRWLPDAGAEDSIEAVQSHAAVRTERRTGAAGLVLLADDNADMREYVRRLLAADYEVVMVADGEEALAAAARRTPDAVITDVMMPKLDGFGLLKALRGDSRTAGIPVIMLSARAGEEARVEGLQAGADDYLIKPFSARDLLARVDAHLKLARLRREAAAALGESEGRYRTLFETLMEGFCIIELIVDEKETPIDYWFVETNPAFERQTGLPAGRGKRARDMAPHLEPDWLETYARVAGTGEPARFVREAKALGRWFDVSAYRVGGPGSRRVAVLFNDITERKRGEQALADLNAKLQEADRRKDEFLAMLAHELRNPLAVMSSATRVVKAAGLGGPSAQRAQEVLERQARHMERLIDDLLDVSRVTRGKVSLKKESVDLSRIIEAAVEGAGEPIEARGQRLFVSLPREPLLLDADAVRLIQAVSNLLNNAAKYTPAGGEIHVSAERRDDRAVVRVRDTGSGIDPALLPHIFDLFVQGDRSPDRAQGGLGIGLTMARSLVEMHGGTIEAHSHGAGTGSEFVIALPLANRHVPAAALNVPVPPLAVPARRILVVDDNPDAADMMRALLEMEGHEVLTAIDGEAAVTLATTHAPDVALIDLGMPGIDGFEVARRLRREMALADTVLVALTGYGQEEDIQKSRTAGFDHHLVKPADLDTLRGLLRSVRAGRV